MSSNTTVLTEERELKEVGSPTFEFCQLTTNLGDTLDILPMMSELVIYEDIFSPVLTGYITIRDSFHLLDRVGISGLESLTLKFWSYNYGDPDKLNYIHRTFKILKLTDINDLNDYTREYSLWFASPEFYKNELIRVSKAYFNTTYSNIVNSVMTGQFEMDEVSGLPPEGLEFTKTSDISSSTAISSPFLTSDYIETWIKKEDDLDSVELFVEKTQYTEPVVTFPYQKPFELINTLAARSVRDCPGKEQSSLKAKQPNFLFFENKRGFQFTSIDSLLENKYVNKTKFRYGSAEQNRPNGNQRDFQYEVIEKLQVTKIFDIIQNMRAGMYSSKLYSLDISSGVVKEFDYDVMEDFDKLESTELSETKYPGFFLDKTGKNEELTRNFLQKRLLVTCSPDSEHSIYGGYDNTQRLNSTNILSGPAEYLQARLSGLARLSNYQVLFETPGNTKYKVGDCVEIDIRTQIPNSDSSKSREDFNSESSKYFSGHHLITSIKHVLTKDKYKMVIEACKDAHKAKYGTE